jgi:hypothetical protein
MLRQLLALRARVEALETEDFSQQKSSKRHLPDWLLQPWVARGLRVGRCGQPDPDALHEFFHKSRSVPEADQSGETALEGTHKEHADEDEVGGGSEE